MMKTSNSPSPSNRPRFWDILVVRQDGQWVGFRAPWLSLRRTASYLSFVFVVTALALTGWLLSRWEVHSLSRDISFQKLKMNALETEMTELKKSAGTGTEGSSVGLPLNMTVLPSLDSEEISSGSHELKDYSAEYDAASMELVLKFEVRKLLPVESKDRYYWIALLHGPHGILSFPSALASRKGESLVFQRGQLLEEIRSRKAISARFKLNQFVENGGAEPLYATILIYDSKGSLILKQRKELTVRPSGASSRAN